MKQSIEQSLEVLQDRPAAFATMTKVNWMLRKGIGVDVAQIDEALQSWTQYRCLDGNSTRVTTAARTLIDAGMESEVLDVLKIMLRAICEHFALLAGLKKSGATAAIQNSLAQRSGEVSIWLLGLNLSALQHFPVAAWREVLTRFCENLEDESQYLALAKIFNRLSNAVVPVTSAAAEVSSTNGWFSCPDIAKKYDIPKQILRARLARLRRKPAHFQDWKETVEKKGQGERYLYRVSSHSAVMQLIDTIRAKSRGRNSSPARPSVKLVKKLSRMK